MPRVHHLKARETKRGELFDTCKSEAESANPF